MADKNLKFPMGEADVVALTAAGDQDITISDDMTILDGVTVEATADRTLNLTVGAGIEKGAKVFIKTKTNGTEDTIYGTGITSANLTGVAGKTFTQEWTFDGSVFLPTGEAEQID